MRVVHCQREKFTHYIGRPQRGQPWNILANRYTHKESVHRELVLVPSRESAIELFEDDARSRPEIIEAIAALPADAVLGCWCDPLPCHGEIIIKIWHEIHG